MRTLDQLISCLKSTSLNLDIVKTQSYSSQLQLILSVNMVTEVAFLHCSMYTNLCLVNHYAINVVVCTLDQRFIGALLARNILNLWYLLVETDLDNKSHKVHLGYISRPTWAIILWASQVYHYLSWTNFQATEWKNVNRDYDLWLDFVHMITNTEHYDVSR